MRQDAHEHGLFWRWRHRNDQPPSTPWTSYRMEQRRKQRTGEALIELLRAPANIEELRAKRANTPGPAVLKYEEWERAHTGPHNPLTPLPATPDTGAMRPVAPPSPHADTQYTMLARPVPPTKAEPHHYTQQELISMIRTQKPSPSVVAQHLQLAQEDRMPAWAMPPDRAELFADVRQPSGTLEDDEPTVEHERTKRNRMFKQAITGLLGKDEIA